MCTHTYIYIYCSQEILPLVFFSNLDTFKGGLEALKNKMNEIWGSKREDRFSNTFFGCGTKYLFVRFSNLLRLSNFCKTPWDMHKFSQKSYKIAGCRAHAMYGFRPPIASKLGSSNLAHPLCDDPV